MKQYLPKVNFQNNFLLLKSMLLNKFLQYNTETVPCLKYLKISFPIFDSTDLTKSKLVMFILDFIENISGLKGHIYQVKIFSKKGIFIRCQVFLNKFNFLSFFSFFNDSVLSNDLMPFTYKDMQLSTLNNFVFKLIIYDLDLFIDSYLKKILPYFTLLWLELDFFFNQKKKYFGQKNFYPYTQMFFSHFFIKQKNS